MPKPKLVGNYSHCFTAQLLLAYFLPVLRILLIFLLLKLLLLIILNMSCSLGCKIACRHQCTFSIWSQKCSALVLTPLPRFEPFNVNVNVLLFTLEQS